MKDIKEGKERTMYLNDDLYEPDEDQISSLHESFCITDKLTNTYVKLSRKVPMVIRYDFISVDGKYGFSKLFGELESRSYFSKMKELAGLSLENAMGDFDYTYHINKTYINKSVKEELKKLFKTEKIAEDLEIYHFALYTSKAMADRKKDIKSPRIHFLLGRYGMVYILFYDPYHELC